MVENEMKRHRVLVSESEKRRLQYCNAIEKIAPQLQKDIKEKNTITMSKKDLAKKMGPEFETKYDIYWGAKYCLFEKGIIVTATKRDHEPAIIMRSRTPDDMLPPTLKRYMEGHF